MGAGGELTEGVEDLHPVLTSMTLSFWRTRLLVERLAGTLPLKMMLLSVVGSEPGIGPGEICRRFTLDFSRVSRLVRSLERDGLLDREHNPQDRRFVHLRLTSAGREHLREQTALINREFSRRLEGLDAKELEELHRMLHVVAESMRL